MTDPTQSMGPTPNDPTHDPANDKQPDTLRDARLAHALRHMPDAHMQPSAQSRSAVLQEAMRAVGGTSPAQPVQPPVAQRRWWHAWLGQPGQRVPWGAAVASLAVFGFITVMWYGQDVPDATPERGPSAVHKDAAKAEPDVGAKTEAVAEAAIEAPIEATAHPSAKKAAEQRAQLATKPAPTIAAAQAAPAAAAPAAPPVADAVVQAPAPAAAPTAPVAARAVPAAPAATTGAVANNASAAADAPASQPQLERRSKSLQAEVAAKDRAQTRESAAPAIARSEVRPQWVLTLGDVTRSIRPEQAQKLLAQLRGLSYDPAATPSQPADRSGDAIRLDWAGQESWVITPTSVVHYLLGADARAGAGTHAGVAAQAQAIAQSNAEAGAAPDAAKGARGALSAQGDAPLRSSISPSQYAQLQRLAMELGAQP